MLVEDLKAQGIGIVYVSHRLEEVERLADRAVVMRDGARVGEAGSRRVGSKKIIEMMVGRSMDAEFPVKKGSGRGSTAGKEPILWTKSKRNITRSTCGRNSCPDRTCGFRAY